MLQVPIEHRCLVAIVPVMLCLLLVQYERTAAAVYEAEDSVDTLVELLLIYRDKGVDIFTNTCMLLGIMASDDGRRQVVFGVHSCHWTLHCLCTPVPSVASRKTTKSTLVAYTSSCLLICRLQKHVAQH